MSYTSGKTLLFPEQNYRQDKYPNGDTIVIDSKTSASLSEVRSGTSVPNFQGKIKGHADASSHYSRRSGRILSQSPHRASLYNPSNEHTYSWTWDWASSARPTLPGTYNFSGLQNRAAAAFYSNLRKEMENFAAIPFVKEFSQTKKLFGETALRLFNHFYHRGGQLGSYARKLKRQGYPWRVASRDISARWLEVQFGLLPTISDLSNLSKALREPSYQNMVIRAHVTDLISNLTRTGTATYSGMQAPWVGYERTHATVRFTAGYRFAPSVADRLGVNLESIPGAIWEITPWSFLVDYFVDVSGWLAARTYASLPMAYATRSDYLTKKGKFITTHGGSSEQTALSKGHREWETIDYDRIALVNPPHYWIPHFSIADAFDGFRSINISALLAQQIRSW